MRKILFSLFAVALCVPAFAGLRQKQAPGMLLIEGKYREITE